MCALYLLIQHKVSAKFHQFYFNSMYPYEDCDESFSTSSNREVKERETHKYLFTDGIKCYICNVIFEKSF